MSLEFKYRVNIEQPVETVWGVITDLPKLPEWFSVQEVHNVASGSLRKGTTFQIVDSMMGVEQVIDYRVAAYDPCQEFAFRSDGKVASVISMRLEPVEAGTRLHFSLSLEVPRLVAPVIRGQVARRLEKDLARLAAMFEAQS